jgi:hypothetical protein
MKDAFELLSVIELGLDINSTEEAHCVLSIKGYWR